MTLFVPPKWQTLPSNLDRTSVDLNKGVNLRKLIVEWWTLVWEKDRQKVHCYKCWTRQWTKETTLPEVIHFIIVLFYMMSSHAKLEVPRTHWIPKAYVNVAMANMIFVGVVVDLEEDCKDYSCRLWFLSWNWLVTNTYYTSTKTMWL